MYCKCSQYWWRHFKEDSILLSNFVIEGRIIGLKKENEKSFYSLILLEQRFPLKIFLAKYVRILVKSVQLGYSSGNLSESLRIYQRPGASKPRIQGIVSVLPGKKNIFTILSGIHWYYLDLPSCWSIHIAGGAQNGMNVLSLMVYFRFGKLICYFLAKILCDTVYW